MMSEELNKEKEAEEEIESRRDTLEKIYDEAVSASEKESTTTEEISKKPESIEEPQAPAPEEPPVMLPRSWARDPLSSEMWAKLPREIQKQITARENQRDSNYQRVLQEIAQKREAFGQIEEAITPHLRELKLDGVDTGKLFQETLEFRRFTKEDPEGAVTWLMQTLGVRPEAVVTRFKGQPQEDPKIQELRQQLQQVQGTLTAAQQAQVARLRGEIESTITSFAEETDENGQPLRPYAYELEEEMEPIVRSLVRQYPQAGMGIILQEAYDRAVWANPQLRAQLLKQQQAAQQQAAQQAAIKARRAASSINGAPAGSVTQAPTSRREALEAAWAAQMSAA